MVRTRLETEEQRTRRASWLAAALVLTAAGIARAGDGDAVVGVWATNPDAEGGQAHIEIFKDNGTYGGRIVWLEKPEYPPDDDEGMAGQTKVDRRNPDPALRDRPVLGLKMMRGFTYAGGNRWEKGTIYHPVDGKTYECEMTLDDDGTLKVRGFIAVSLLGRTEVWTPVEADDES